MDHSWREDLIPLGLAIRELREGRGLEAADLADAAGVDRKGLDALENGWIDPDFQLLLRLAQSMGMRPSAFFLRAEQLSAEQKGRRA